MTGRHGSSSLVWPLLGLAFIFAAGVMAIAGVGGWRVLVGALGAVFLMAGLFCYFRDSRETTVAPPE